MLERMVKALRFSRFELALEVVLSFVMPRQLLAVPSKTLFISNFL